MMMAPSSPPLAIRLSSGDTVTDVTTSLCPSNGPPTHALFSTFQIRRVLSFEAVTIHRPSLKNATARTVFVCNRIVCVGTGWVVCAGVERLLTIRDASFDPSPRRNLDISLNREMDGQ